MEILDDFNEYFDEHAKIVAVKYFFFESEARIYAARLKEVGIRSFLSNANTTTVIPLGNGGIGLHVKADQVVHAKQIIQTLDEMNRNENMEESFREADHEDIAYQRDLHLQKNKEVNPLYLLLFFIIAFLILMYFAKNPIFGPRNYGQPTNMTHILG